MTRLSRATLEARLDLALAALKRAGEPVGGIEVARDGQRRQEPDRVRNTVRNILVPFPFRPAAMGTRL